MWAAILLMLISIDHQRHVPIEEQIVIEESITIDCTIAAADNSPKDVLQCSALI